MSWTQEQDAIWAHWRTNRPIAAARCDESDWNGAKFNPPAVDAITPANSIWIRFVQRAVQRSGRPFVLGASAPNYRQGMVVFQIFYPRGVDGEAYVASTIQSCWSMFHRLTLSADPQIQFGDSHPPERIPPGDDRAEWMQVNVLTPYEVIEN